ncbi:N-alpha-acetyltransferase 38, NatC auxiliary subunit-like [Drosophila persimilis]|uniref:N-alpha-acetyltransferase 38, NatC auxiliary subunit-like n=1 Tax=Drosophila persimilis TaxID=7234 RepID=UPI000F096A55|nr:N-alpha-acetyltransferase 38, NatC auxiliary subunit-like [Drosophila persimilis]
MNDPKACGSQKPAPAVYMILSNTPDEMNDPTLSPGRRQLQKWLGRRMRIVLTDGRILIGVFSCTDQHVNIVLTKCREYLVQGGQGRALRTVMVQGKHIVNICLDTTQL